MLYQICCLNCSDGLYLCKFLCSDHVSLSLLFFIIISCLNKAFIHYINLLNIFLHTARRISSRAVAIETTWRGEKRHTDASKCTVNDYPLLRCTSSENVIHKAGKDTQCCFWRVRHLTSSSFYFSTSPAFKKAYLILNIFFYIILWGWHQRI